MLAMFTKGPPLAVVSAQILRLDDAKVAAAHTHPGTSTGRFGKSVGLLTVSVTAVADRITDAPPVTWLLRAEVMLRPNRRLQSTKPLTALIPAYNEGKFIADTIKSVQNQTTPVERIIVIDDCSTDDTGDVARALGVEVIRPLKNQGSKASALNYAVDLIKTEYTLAIDADTTLADDAIEALMREFDDPAYVNQVGASTIACVCGMVIPRNVRTLWERGRYLEYLYAFGFFKPVQDYYGRPLIASGCFSAYRTSVLKEMGGWNQRTVGEDMDLTWTIYLKGLDVRFAEKAICYPVEPHNYDFMTRQLKRWSAGFVQCVKVHWKDLLSAKGVRAELLRSMVFIGLWDAIIATAAFFLLIPLLAIFVHPLFLLAYFIDIPTVFVPVMYQAAKRGEIGRALGSLPGFFVLRFVNALFIARALWTELVLNKPIKVFEKGH